MPRPPADRLRILAARLRDDAEHDRVSDVHNFFGDLRELISLVDKWAESVELLEDETLTESDVLMEPFSKIAADVGKLRPS